MCKCPALLQPNVFLEGEGGFWFLWKSKSNKLDWGRYMLSCRFLSCFWGRNIDLLLILLWKRLPNTHYFCENVGYIWKSWTQKNIIWLLDLRGGGVSPKIIAFYHFQKMDHRWKLHVGKYYTYQIRDFLFWFVYSKSAFTFTSLLHNSGQSNATEQLKNRTLSCH